MQGQIEPQRQRPEVHRGRERVVDQAGDAGPLGEVHDLAQPRDPHQRVADRLDQDGAGVRPAGLLPGLRALRVDERVAPPEVVGVPGQEVVRSAVQAVADQQVVTGTHFVTKGVDRGILDRDDCDVALALEIDAGVHAAHGFLPFRICW